MKSEHAQVALTIVEGFIEKGIPAEEILPRENVFTFHAWLAKNRVVKKGEHGVKVTTFVQSTKADKDGKFPRYPKTTTVFHISQTEEIECTS